MGGSQPFIFIEPFSDQFGKNAAISLDRECCSAPQTAAVKAAALIHIVHMSSFAMQL